MDGSNPAFSLEPGGVRPLAALQELVRRNPRGLPTAVLVAMFSVYFIIGALTPGRALYELGTPLDAAIPLWPEWMLIYGSVYVFLFLPLFVVVDPRLFRRVVRMSLLVMFGSYLGFLVFPTYGPRPQTVPVDGFLSWALRFNYSLDPPYNCFPSLHVGHAVVATLACSVVHRGVGLVAGVWTGLIAVSTLFTKQHYVVDVLGGWALALLAARMFLSPYPRSEISDEDRRLAPRRARGALAAYFALIAGFFAAWRMVGAFL